MRTITSTSGEFRLIVTANGRVNLHQGPASEDEPIAQFDGPAVLAALILTKKEMQ